MCEVVSICIGNIVCQFTSVSTSRMAQVSRPDGEGKRDPVNPAVRAAVRRLVSTDALLYDHFNATLWTAISAQGPQFWDEVAELRARVARVRFCGVGWTRQGAHE